MISNVAAILIFLSVFGIVTPSPDRAVDCRKFVFAPLCRGVAAKRNNLNLGQYESPIANKEKLIHLLKSLLKESETSEENEEDNQLASPTSRQYGKEHFAQMNEQERINFFLKLLLESKKFSSERDNYLADDSNNL